MPYNNGGSEIVEPPSLGEYLSWKHPYRDTRIYVHAQLVRTLSSRALNAAKQASEIGGILWGKTGQGDSLVIADATLISSAERLFNTNAVDARNIGLALQGAAPRANVSLVGYFRSHAREGLCLSPQDQALIEQRIRDPDAVFLIIKPFSEIGTCMAGFFFRKNGRLQADVSDLEIPFVATSDHHRRDSGATEAHETPSTEKEEAFKREKRSIPEVLRESATRRTQPRNTSGKSSLKTAVERESAAESVNRAAWPLLIGVMFILAIVLIAGAGAYSGWSVLAPRVQSEPQKPPEAGIDLRVVPAANGQLNLNWHRNAPEVTKAGNGILTIRDGHTSHEVNLDNTQLRSGKLIYFPKSKSVLFRLEVNVDRRHTMAESVWTGSPGESAHHEKPAFSGQRRTRSKASVARATTAVEKTGPGTESKGSSPPLFQPPPSTPLVTATVSVSPKQSNLSSTYVPPRVIAEMMPDTTALGHFAQVSVQLSIDPAGHVIAAQAQEDAKPGDSMLTGVALASAKQWLFEPATLNGKPVPAEYTIVFAFHPQ
jgi:hypothetical protein